MSGIPFPNIDPIAIEIDPLAIRWSERAAQHRKRHRRACMAGGG